MKIGILSDIHGNDVAFEAVEEDMNRNHVNCVVFLGDLVAKGPQPQACFDRMKRLKPLVWLKGNTEYWLDDALINIMPTSRENRQLLAYYDYLVKHMDGPSMDYLITLDHMRSLKLGHFDGTCCHGTPWDPSESLEPEEDVSGILKKLIGNYGVFVLSGHSHRQFDIMYHGIRLINPGSVGIPAQEGSGIAHYGIIDANSSFKVTLRQVSYKQSDYEEISVESGFSMTKETRS